MERSVFIEYWKKAEFQNRILIGVVVIQSITLIVIGMAFWKSIGWQKVILVPPVIPKAVTVGGMTASPEYITVMAKYLVQEVMEFTPDDIESRIRTVLFFLPPEFSKKVEESLDDLKIQVQKTGLSQIYRQDYMLVMDNGFAYFQGNIQRFLHGQANWQREVRLQMEYSMTDGKFALLGIRIKQGPFIGRPTDASLISTFREVPEKAGGK